MHNFSDTKIATYPKLLWFFMLSYCTVMLLANWFNPRLIEIFNLNTDAGTIIFPFTYLLSDVITEVYGYKNARRAIWCGLLFNLIFIIYGQIIIHLPSPSFHTNNQNFDTLFAADIRTIVASAISYLCAEPFNSYVLAKLKIKWQGKFISVRFITSTIIAGGIDSFIFTTIAFYGMMSNAHLISFILTMWLFKVMIEAVGLPISVMLSKKVKTLERLDIYDKNTNFNIFSWDAKYTTRDNSYNQDANSHNVFKGIA